MLKCVHCAQKLWQHCATVFDVSTRTNQLLQLAMAMDKFLCPVAWLVCMELVTKSPPQVLVEFAVQIS